MITIGEIKKFMKLPFSITLENEEEICMRYDISSNGKKLPENFKGLLCWMIAIQVNPKNAKILSLIPEDKSVYNIVFQTDASSIQYVKGASPYMCYVAFNTSKDSFCYFPDSCKSKEMCQEAFNHKQYFFKYIPIKHRTINMYKDYFFINKFNIDVLIKEVNKNPISDVVEAAYFTNKSILPELKSEYLTEAICEDAINENPNNIKYFPIKLITENMCTVAFDFDPNNIEFIPSEYITQDMCNKSFNESHGHAKYFPTNMITKEMSQILLEEDTKNIKLVPREHITKEFCDNIFENHRDMLKRYFKFFPDEFKTKEMIDYLGADPDVSIYYPTELLDLDLIKKLLRFRFSLAEEQRLMDEYLLIKDIQAVEKYLETRWDDVENKSEAIEENIIYKIDQSRQKDIDLYKKAIEKYTKENIEIVTAFVNSDQSGKFNFARTYKITVHRLEEAASFVKDYMPELYNAYVERSVSNSHDFRKFIQKNIEYVEENISNPDFNLLTYYMNTSLNPYSLLEELYNNSISDEIIKEYEQKIFGRHIDPRRIRAYKNNSLRTVYDKVYAKEFKKQSNTVLGTTFDKKDNYKIVKFLSSNEVPINKYTLSLAQEMIAQGKLNIEDNVKVEKIDYELTGETQEIEGKLKTIVIQNKSMELLDDVLKNKFNFTETALQEEDSFGSK